ncbi:RNA polymerase sigma factor [Spirillospora sp. CA-108201]
MRPDEERFTALFRQHHARVLAYALRRTDAARADDVVAETFTAAWRHASALPDDPLPWLYRTAANCLANQHRSRVRQERLAGRLAGEPARTGPDPAHGVVEQDRLTDALARLGAADREALLLVSWEGLDNHAAAYAAGCSATAFKVRLHRARKRLAALLAEPEPDSAPVRPEVAR